MILKELIELLGINGSDIKGTDKDTKHSYLEVYEDIFYYYRNKEINILEIGVQFGASSQLWHEYFQKSKLTLIDIEYLITDDIKSRLIESRFDLIITDAYEDNCYNKLKFKKFDIIIDDGPHTLDSQIFVLDNYLNNLSENGILIIEDVQDYSHIEIFKNKLNNNFQYFIYDLRNEKNRYDDLLFVVKRKSNFGICYPVYNNQKAFDSISKKLLDLPCPITIVDDGSNPPLLVKNLSNINLIRLDNNINWNQANANNIAIENSDFEIILRIDIDHYIYPEDFEKFKILSNDMEENTIYQFNRFRTDTKEFINKGCNIMMIRKSDFNKIGKYNEAFCGNYGYEDLEFQNRAIKLGYEIKLSPLVIYVDASHKTPDLVRDTTINKNLFLKIKNNEI